MKLKTHIKRCFNYIKDAWEGNDGKFSYQRASQFVFVALVSKLTVMGFVNIYQIYALLILCITFLLLAAIIKWPEVVEFIKAARGSFPGSGVNVTTTTETEVQPISKADQE